MGTKSANTYEFDREDNDDGKQSLYTAFRRVIDTVQGIDNKRMQQLAEDYIFVRKNNPNSQIAKYDDEGKKLYALGMMAHLTIHVKSIKKNEEDKKIYIKSLVYEYGQSNQCVYMLYIENIKHYFGLYVSNMENAIFPNDDPDINDSLERYLQKEYPNYIEQGSSPEPLSEIDKSIDGIQEIENTIIESSDEDASVTKKYTEQSELLNVGSVVHKGDDESRMKFEVEPIKSFRGRTKGDFEPKEKRAINGKIEKSKKKNVNKNQTTKIRAPRYFADRNNKHLFNLLIPERYLADYLEYCIEMHIITRDLKGNSYINPYFNVRIHPTDDQIAYVNPMKLEFKNENLGTYTKGVKVLPMQFVIVKTTNSDLMNVKQPLTLFASKNNETKITRIFKLHRTFKKQYHLNKLRFAINLYGRRSNEEPYELCTDASYISQISTEIAKK